MLPININTSAMFIIVGQYGNVKKSTTYPYLMRSTRFPRAPPTINPTIISVNLLNFTNNGTIESPTIIINVRYITASFTPAKSPKAIPLFVA